MSRFLIGIIFCTFTLSISHAFLIHTLANKIHTNAVKEEMDIQEINQHTALLAEAIKTLSYQCDVVTNAYLEEHTK